MSEDIRETQPEGSGEPRTDGRTAPPQRLLLPQEAPRIDGYEVAGGTATEETGPGDTVWDWVSLGAGGTAILTYRVVGDGLTPTHQLHAVRVLFRALGPECRSISELFARTNSALVAAAPAGVQQFVECGAVVVDDAGVTWASAGRVPAGLIRRAGAFDEMTSHGPPLGMMDGFRYASQHVELGTGDVMVVLSRASTGLLRGAADLVVEVQGKPAGEVVRTLHRAIRKAAENGPEETSVLYLRKN